MSHPDVIVVGLGAMGSSAAIGEAVAQRLLDGRSDLDLSSFSLARFREKEVVYEH